MIYTSIFLTGLISLILLLNHWSQNKGVVYLVISILCTNVRQMMLLLLNTKEEPAQLAALYLNFDPLICLVGPCVLYYFKSIIKGKLVLDFRFIWHLTPALFVLVNTYPYYFVAFSEKLAFVEQVQRLDMFPINTFPYLFMPYQIQKYFLPAVNLTYAFYAILYVFKNRQGGTIYLKKKITTLLNRGILIVILITFPTLVLSSYILINSLPYFKIVNPRFNLTSIFYLFTLIVPLSFFLFPSWLYGENENQSILNRLLYNLKRIFNQSAGLDYPDFNKSADLERILLYVEQNRPYLQERFSLHDISRALNIPHVRVTNCFNKQLAISFPLYRNKLRIEYATELLRKGAHVANSIDGISSKSGFKSKTAFYSAFKTEHGKNPMEWIKENVNS